MLVVKHLFKKITFYDDKKGVFKVLRPKNALRLIMRGERKNCRLYVAIFAAKQKSPAES